MTRAFQMAALAAALATPVIAQDTGFPPGLYARGYADLSFAWSGGDADRFVQMETDLGYRVEGSVIGFNLGVDAVRTPTRLDWGFYPSVDFTFGPGRIAVGNPRSVIDQGYLPRGFLAGSSSSDIHIAPTQRSAFRKQIMIDGAAAYGLRYDGNYGATSVGATIHKTNDPSDDYLIYALAVRHELGAVGGLETLGFFGALEHVRHESGASNTFPQFGAEGSVGPVDFSILYTGLAGNGHTVELNLGVEVMDNLSVNAGYYKFTEGSETEIYGVGMEYMILDVGYFDAGVVKNSDFGDSTYEMSVGFRF